MNSLDKDIHVPGLGLIDLVLVPEGGPGGVHVLEGGGVVEAGVRPHHDPDDAGDGGRVDVGAAAQLPEVGPALVYVGCEGVA